MTLSERLALFLRARSKPTLPEGYQYLDARPVPAARTADSGLQPFIANDLHAGEQH